MSKLEETLLLQIRATNTPLPIREHRFHKVRRWRFDFAWPDHMLAVEVDGGVWSGGRHTRGKGYINDCDKINTATDLGWRVLRFTGEHIKSGSAIEMIERMIND